MDKHLGAHMSAAGGYAEAVKRVQAIGGNCLQLFSTSPRGWKPAHYNADEPERFKTACQRYGVGPVYFHASYLINLAGSEQIQVKSIDSLIAELATAHAFGIRGSVIHLGSFGADAVKERKRQYSSLDTRYQTLINNSRTVLKDTPDDALFIIEQMGMRKIGLDLEEIAFLVEQLNNSRVRVCLDTCHMHAAGFDLSSHENLTSFLKRFDELIGLELLEVMHINDSRDPLGALRDRHENLGEGEIDPGTFESIGTHSQLQEVPFILETPGFSGNGPDRENMKRLRQYTSKA